MKGENHSDPNPQDALLLEHEYDGIGELDNKLPRWWVWLFILTSVFAAAYLVYYHVSVVRTRVGNKHVWRLDLHDGKIMQREYGAEMAVGARLKAKAMEGFESSLASLQPSKEPEVLAGGKETFAKLCSPCHAADGGGLVGPNLCDDYWIHGSNFVDNVRTIWDGVPAKGMVTWKNSLRHQQVFEVASFIYTLRGTHPKNPKPPENTAPVKTGPSEFE
jgi:cytochrome c oxidase cbb3-type subunit 3